VATGAGDGRLVEKVIKAARAHDVAQHIRHLGALGDRHIGGRDGPPTNVFRRAACAEVNAYDALWHCLSCPSRTYPRRAHAREQVLMLRGHVTGRNRVAQVYSNSCDAPLTIDRQRVREFDIDHLLSREEGKVV
jgi:hypothetical protein